MEGKEKGAHEWMIEFKKAPENIEAFHKMMKLQTLNSDYEGSVPIT
jgi:hypothetical protein